MADAVSTGPPSRKATNLEGYVIGGVGVLTALAVLVAGASAGYGLAAAVAHSTGQPLTPLSRARLGEPGPLSVAGMFAMAGFLIEALRFQGQPREGRFFRAWAAA